MSEQPMAEWERDILAQVDEEARRIRHPKWRRVTPGTVIPAGQPVRIEFPAEFVGRWGDQSVTAKECLYETDHEIVNAENDWFVDSTWTPPLELPTEPTWGIAVTKWLRTVNEWTTDRPRLVPSDAADSLHCDDLLDFIPLTPEQVARIESAR